MKITDKKYKQQLQQIKVVYDETRQVQLLLISQWQMMIR